MKVFDLKQPTTIDEAVDLLKKGDAAPLAGGSDVMSTYKSMCTPNTAGTLVDLKSIDGLSYIKEEGNYLKIGALTTLTEIANSELLNKSYAALAMAADVVGTTELRNIGTIGGNICQRNRCWYYRNEDNLFPCLRKGGSTCYAITGDNRYHSIFKGIKGCFAVCPSDTASVLVAFGATIVTTKKSWEATDFFAVNGEKQVAIDDDEIVTEIQIPKATSNTKSYYKKYSIRKAFDFPIVGAAVVLEMDGSKVKSASVALSGVYNIPKVADVEDALVGKEITESTAEAAGDATIKDAKALSYNEDSTTEVGNAYMIQMAKIMVKRAILALK